MTLIGYLLVTEVLMASAFEFLNRFRLSSNSDQIFAISKWKMIAARNIRRNLTYIRVIFIEKKNGEKGIPSTSLAGCGAAIFIEDARFWNYFLVIVYV